MKTIRILAAALTLVCLLPRYSAQAATNNSADCCILMDADTGAVLYEKNADVRRLIASTTKIMTAYLVCSQCDLDAVVQIPDEAVGVEGSSVYLQAGEELTGRELLLCMMLHSGNDAATALAVLCAGSVGDFVSQMNETALALGLTGTHYANPHGLDSAENYGTARDLAKLSAEALQNETFLQVVSTKAATVSGGRILSNHNKLLWRCEGCIGVKTGYTKSAGRILVSAARRNGRTLICVTVSDPNDWDDHVRLLDEGFSRYTSTALAKEGELLCETPLTPDGVQTARLVAAVDLEYALLPDEQVRREYNGDASLFSNLYLGQPAGTVTVYVDDREVGTVPVVWG